MTIKEYCESSHDYAIRRGFWDLKDSTEIHIFQIVKLGLLCSEVGEAIEAVRIEDKKNLAEECADIFIRLADFCEAYKIDLEEEVRNKMKKNELRARMHGKNS